MKAAARWLVIAAALGLLHALAFAPWGRWWLALLVLAAFSAIVRTQVAGDAGVGRAAAAGLLFGVGWFLAGVGWLYVSMHTYGAMAAPLAALALALFAGYLALFPAAARSFSLPLTLGQFGLFQGVHQQAHCGAAPEGPSKFSFSGPGLLPKKFLAGNWSRKLR